MVEQGAKSIAHLINGAPSQITFFHNTTAGVQRIFLRLSHLFGPAVPTLLTTDLEYPGIVSLVDENWNGRLIMTQIAELINTGQADLVTERLKRSILATRPSVVYLSHVGRANGYRIDEDIVHYIKEVNPSTVIIIDGAQACGNIYLDRGFLEEVDFYVTSGHKWLCAKATLGIVHAHENWKLKDPAQSYSKTQASTGTGNSSALLSLRRAVADFNGETTPQTPELRMRDIESHNRRLAEYFSSEMVRRCGLKSLGILNGEHARGWRCNGIVVVNLPSEEIVNELQKQPAANFKFTVLTDENWRDKKVGGEPLGGRYLLDCDASEAKHFFKQVDFQDKPIPGTGPYWSRFCFHYYHTKTDVDDLVEKIERVIPT